MIHKIKTFFHNVWFFRKELASFQPWDHGFNLEFYKRSLVATEKFIRLHGCHLNHKKEARTIRIVIKLIDRITNDEYYNMYFNYVPNGFLGDLVKKEHIPKSYSSLLKRDSLRSDSEYLYKLIQKHSATWWD